MSAVDIFPNPTRGSPGDYQSVVPSATQIFPSSTAPSGNQVSGATTNGVYYLVFLGILLALIVLAGALTIRSYRSRARYRTQTQLAIGRGDAPTNWWGDDVWGVPWVGWTPVRPRRERRWMPIPVLFDAVPEPEKDGLKEEDVETEVWDDIQPLSVQSLLAPEPEPEPAYPAPLPEPPGGRLRTARVGFRRHIGLDVIPAPQDPPRPTPRAPEINRSLSDGEPVRIAVMVQMPTECDVVSALSDDDEIAWQPGMEIGVWEGIVAGGTMSMSRDDNAPSEFTQYVPPAGPPPSDLRPFNPYDLNTTSHMPNTLNRYERPCALSLDTGDAGSGSTLWTPAKAVPSSSALYPRSEPMEPPPETLQPQQPQPEAQLPLGYVASSQPDDDSKR